METDQVHVAELCSRLYGFHSIQGDTDVSIECEGQKFLCHRAVLAAKSEYFERMFRNVWKESVTGSVIFAEDHMKVTTLLEVLKYLYAGNATITSGNFVDLLYASDYLGVPWMEAHLVRMMLQNRPEPIVDLLEVLFFAHRVNNQSLINVLANCNMTELLKKFFESTEFLDIPADLFWIIVSKLWRSPPIVNEVLRRAIYRWKFHALKEREQDALELHKCLEPASEISLAHSIGSSHLLLETRSDLHKTVAATPNPSLFVYAEDEYRRLIKVFKYNGTNLRFEKFVLKQISIIRDSKIRRPFRFVSVDNVGVFSMAIETENWYNFYPTLTQFASANICGFGQGLALARPPINLLRDFELCNVSNRGLYLLPRMSFFYLPLDRNAIYDASKQEFSDDEIERGIYFYNMELDRWYPVPAMIRHPWESCMTVLDNNVVYVIGSVSNEKTVQAYDHRERQWHSKPNVLHNHTKPQSCVLDGRIYVRSSGYCERYDPIAGKWENVEGLQTNHFQFQRLVPYKNQLWHFTKIMGINHLIHVYDPPSASWSTVFKTTEQILDAVVW